MPRYNGTGPQGMGPGTGGRRGPCFSNAAPVDQTDPRGAGRGFAPRGGGRGRAFAGGRGPGFAGRPAQDETAENLKRRAAVLEQELAEIRSRIDAQSGARS